MIDSRTTLIALSIKYKGDWEKILTCMNKREFPEQEYLDMAINLKCGAVTMMDMDYPEYLRHIYRPPFVLFYYGDVSLLSNYQKNVSIVGSREYSPYGELATRDIASGLAKEGYAVVSGMALGIDSIAHEECINNGGKTIAVLGSGIDCCYPASNSSLYKRIKENHLVISEYYGNQQPNPENFPIRNRIIAGLSKTLVVTEARERSGTLITVSLALRNNTDVMCVPYPTDTGSKCNRLIRAGAILVENAKDVIESIKAF